VRVGFVRSVLWSRYGPFWERLIREAAGDVVVASAPEVERWWADPRLDAISGRAFRLAGAEALALASCDLLLVPAVNAGYEGHRGSAQDPFVADLPASLAQVLAGLPRVVGIPTDLDAEGLEALAVTVLHIVNPSPGLVRRVWQTHRTYAKPRSLPGVPAPSLGSPRLPVALVGQPWNLNDAVASLVAREGEAFLRADHLPVALLREEGWRLDPKMAPSDAEALGAVRRFARRSDVTRFRLIVDPESGADAWLAKRVRDVARKPVEEIQLPAGAFQGVFPQVGDETLGEAPS